MIEADSLADMLLQYGLLVLLGALLIPLGRLLRFRQSEPAISNPRSSALWALFAIGAGWVLVLAFLLAVSGGARMESQDSQRVSEFAYRGYLQTRLIGWVGRYQGWVLASVLMAMANIGHRVVVLRMSGGEALASSASLIPISMFLGYVMLRTQSIVAPGLLHTMINWLGL